MKNQESKLMSFISKIKVRTEKNWLDRGDHRVLNLFKQMAERVPAYRKFLKENNINPTKVRSIRDFKKIPLTNKSNYLKKNSIEDLCWDGDFKKNQWVFSATSGTTGNPFYFPRTFEQTIQYAAVAEIYLNDNFDIQKKSTLYINGFALGVWIGGLFTFEAITQLAKKGKCPLSIINPGLNKEAIVKSVRDLGEKFDQIILAGYPPFIKDVIDMGTYQKLNWSKYNLKFIFSAESFSENFRDYLQDKTGFENIYTATLNHYGTVDMGTMAYETPYSILLRRKALELNLTRSLFKGSDKLPTVAQYIPELFYFEEYNNGLICSAKSGFPLVRYDLKDIGGVLLKGHADRFFAENDINVSELSRKYHFFAYNLPVVYVFERSDLTVSLYGLNIYPETIKKFLQGNSLCKEYLTGKFSMLTKSDKNQNQYLEINLELKMGTIAVSKMEVAKIKKGLVDFLRENNSEYQKLYKELGQKIAPKIFFWEYENIKFFKPGGKHRWTIKT